MSLLALSWYAYVSIIATTVVAVGGALAALTGWGRVIVRLARRLLGGRRERTRAETAEPTHEQRMVLNAVYQHFLDHGTRAPFRQLDVHELLHLRVPNHGRLWKSLMRAHLGDYEELHQRLRVTANDRLLGDA